MFNHPDTKQTSPAESSLLITEPYFNLPNLQDVYDQFVFEEYEFQSYYRCVREFCVCPSAWTRADDSAYPAAAMVSHSAMFKDAGSPPPECVVVVDSGFSYTHVIPIMNGDILWHAVKRSVYESSTLDTSLS